MKLCNVCKIEKDESEFLKDKSRKGGIRGKCLKCSRNYINRKVANFIDEMATKKGAETPLV